MDKEQQLHNYFLSSSYNFVLYNVSDYSYVIVVYTSQFNGDSNVILILYHQPLTLHFLFLLLSKNRPTPKPAPQHKILNYMVFQDFHFVFYIIDIVNVCVYMHLLIPLLRSLFLFLFLQMMIHLLSHVLYFYLCKQKIYISFCPFNF